METTQIATSTPPWNFRVASKCADRFIAMHLFLSLCITLSIGRSARAQGYIYPSNSEYDKTVQYEVDDDAAFNTTTDPRVNLTMNSMAANGYGQWTLSTDVGAHANISGHDWDASPAGSFTNNQSGWFLLSNILAKPALSASSGTLDCQPPGVVSGGAFNGTLGDAQVTANLNGAVRYVWPSSDNLSFVVQGLSDSKSVPASGHTAELDISVSTLPVPASTRQIVKHGIFSYSNASVQDHAVPTPLNHTIDNTDGGSRNEFWVACDVYNLYIVWVSKANLPIGVTGEIWATVVDMVDGTTPSGFPMKVSTAGSSGYRPTVACDVRNGSTPKFDVAYIDKSSNQVILQEFSGSTLVTGHSETLPLQFKNPRGTTPGNISFTGVSHATVLVSSVDGVSTPMHAVYAIDFNTVGGVTTNDDIMMYKGITWSSATDNAYYVDGRQMNTGTGTGLYPSPIITDGTKTQLQNIHDEPITAFANPYDQQDAGTASVNYDQFHCLYRADYTTKKDGTANAPITPLFMVKGYNIGTSYPSTTSDTRLLLNQDGTCSSSDPGHSTTDDPTSYCGAVNQMGIHVHWRVSTASPQKHYYVRNIRSFDEAIEENTLMTNDCYIDDGSAHGGLSTGTEISKDGVIATLWTDPNYGAVNGSTYLGLYLNDPVAANLASYPDYWGALNQGSLIYNANDLQLEVTTTSPFDETHFYSFPTTRFDVGSGVTDGGTVSIGSGGTWDFFGASSPTKLVPGATLLTGSSSGPAYAYLNIHGGSVFPGKAVTGSYGDVEILYEQSISPMNTTATANADKTGILEFLNTGNSITHCVVNSYVPTVSSLVLDQVVMKVLGAGSGTTPTSLTSSYTDYTNTGTGAATIQFNTPSSTTAPNAGYFDHGRSSRFDIAIYEPINGCTVSNMTFDNFFLPIMVNRSASLSSAYGSILISGNTFEDYSEITVPSGFLICGISALNCNTGDGTSDGSLNISDNIFATANSNLQAAIFLENSNGNVSGNSVTAEGWRFGIEDIGSSTISPVPMTHAYFCHNLVTDASDDGMLSSHYEGIVKLCRFTECDEGYSSGVFDHPRIIFSSLTSNTNAGLESATSSSWVDLSGIHGASSGSDDYAAYDTIESNASGLSIGQVTLADAAFVQFGKDSPTSWWTEWGRNNTIGSSSNELLITAISGTPDLGSIDNNYWGGADPSTATGTQPGPMVWDGTNTNSDGVYFTASSGSTLTSLQGHSFTVSCSGGLSAGPNTGDNQLALSAQRLSDDDSCQHWKQWESGILQTEEEYQMRFDTLKRYIESCAAIDDDSYRAFTLIYGALSNIHQLDSTRWNTFREWLISVLFLNTTNPHYYCNCIGAMVGTYGVEPYRIANAGIAIERFLIADSNCNDEGLRTQLQIDIDSRFNHWVHGDMSTPLDTIDPSLDTLGLGFLLHRGIPGSTEIFSGTSLSDCSSSPNPFVGDLSINFMLKRMTYTTIAIYDPLGRMVWGDGKGRSLDAGAHTIHIDGSSLPSGTLYARISTGFGEVKTVKLVKN